MATFKLRVNIKIGDKHPVGSPKRNRDVLDGYVVDYQCDGGNSPYWAESDKQSGTARAYGILETTVPEDDWPTVENILKLAAEPNEVMKDGKPDPVKYRSRGALVTLSDVEQTLFQPGLEAAWRSRDCIPAVQVADWSKLLGLFKSTDITNAAAIDVNQVSIGTFTVGPAVGDDYATFALAYADIANLTGGLTFTLNGDVTEVGLATISEDLGGFTFTTTSNDYHFGDNTRGHLLTIAHNNHGFALECEGPGTVNFCRLRSLRSVAGAAAVRGLVFVVAIVVECTINLYQNMHNGGGLVGRGIGISNATPIVNIYTNMIWNCAGNGTNFDVAPNVNNVYETNTIYTCVTGISIGNRIGTWRRCAAYANTTDYTLPGAATGTNNQSDDATAADGNWGVGADNQINGDPAVDFESVLPADEATFLRPVAGSVLEATAPFTAIAANTTDIADIPWADGGWYIGAKSRPVPPAPPPAVRGEMPVRQMSYRMLSTGTRV